MIVGKDYYTTNNIKYKIIYITIIFLNILFNLFSIFLYFKQFILNLYLCLFLLLFIKTNIMDKKNRNEKNRENEDIAGKLY